MPTPSLKMPNCQGDQHNISELNTLLMQKPWWYGTPIKLMYAGHHKSIRFEYEGGSQSYTKLVHMWKTNMEISYVGDYNC